MSDSPQRRHENAYLDVLPEEECIDLAEHRRQSYAEKLIRHTDPIRNLEKK